jgi:Ca2+-transporting ATPase
MDQHQWHSLASTDILKNLTVDADTGLSSDEARKRLEQYGPNELAEGKGVSSWELLFQQFKNVLVIILIIAVGLSAFLGHEIESIAIGVIVLFAVILGFVQEYRAEKAMEALRKMSAPTAQQCYSNNHHHHHNIRHQLLLEKKQNLVLLAIF